MLVWIQIRVFQLCEFVHDAILHDHILYTLNLTKRFQIQWTPLMQEPRSRVQHMNIVYFSIHEEEFHDAVYIEIDVMSPPLVHFMNTSQKIDEVGVPVFRQSGA